MCALFVFVSGDREQYIKMRKIAKNKLYKNNIFENVNDCEIFSTNFMKTSPLIYFADKNRNGSTGGGIEMNRKLFISF
jgi:hypothetical protein